MHKDLARIHPRKHMRPGAHVPYQAPVWAIEASTRTVVSLSRKPSVRSPETTTFIASVQIKPPEMWYQKIRIDQSYCAPLQKLYVLEQVVIVWAYSLSQEGRCEDARAKTRGRPERKLGPKPARLAVCQPLVPFAAARAVIVRLLNRAHAGVSAARAGPRLSARPAAPPRAMEPGRAACPLHTPGLRAILCPSAPRGPG